MLITKRLVIRPLTEKDAAVIFSIRSNDEINKYLDRKPCESIEEAEAFINKVNTASTAGDSCYWGIAMNHELIGTICLWNFNEEKTTTEIGFELLPEHQGKGLMREAVDAVVDFAFNNLMIEELDGFTNPGNVSSRKLLEKIGFRELAGTGSEVKFCLRPEFLKTVRN